MNDENAIAKVNIGTFLEIENRLYIVRSIGVTINEEGCSCNLVLWEPKLIVDKEKDKKQTKDIKEGLVKTLNCGD